jgi:hypothetical protein
MIALATLASIKWYYRYGVQYPNLYASKENCEDEKSIRLFNCVQRGHQHSLEVLPTFLTLLVLAGLEVSLLLCLLLAPDFNFVLRCKCHSAFCPLLTYSWLS